MTHSSWCESIAKLGNKECNCSASYINACKKWNPTISGRCACGLPWIQHTSEARNGYSLPSDYDPKIPASESKAEKLMSDDEAIKWLLSIGQTRNERIEKLQDLIHHARGDKMSKAETEFLSDILDILHSTPADPKDEARRTAPKKYACSMCTRIQTEDPNQPCPDCREAMEELGA